jgi:hypothetical protein
MRLEIEFVLDAARHESSNHQTPNTREAPNAKLQHGLIPATFGIWSLDLLWSLVFGFWCFADR